jgi:predicted HicB family RNase H-like nuclease
MEYKGYKAQIEYDDTIRAFVGYVIDTRDQITFQATSVDSLETEFHRSVDDYLEWCQSDGVEPDKPYSGNLVLRISPELHRSIARESADAGLSINSYIAKKLKDH